jgi:hypothetical protein
MTCHAGPLQDVAYLFGLPAKSGINLINTEGCSCFLDNEMEGMISLKKIFILTLIIFVLFCAGGAGTYKIMNNAKKYNEKQDLQKVTTELSSETVENIEEAEPLTETQLREQEQIDRITEMKYDLNLKEDATQDIVMDVMHKMTHQKVRAEKKEGALPMSNDTINQVHHVVYNSNFQLKDDLLDILAEWRIGNFSRIAEDHNYLWEYQGGTSGKAYGQLGLAEEVEFINQNFH